ncbi:MAG: hypothetical protein R3E13_01220 [Alphaproteobacteria bacterium]
MIRTVTFDNHPKELAVVHAQTPSEFIGKASDILSPNRSPLQGVVWARDGAQDGSQTASHEELVAVFRKHGDKRYEEEELTATGKVCHVTGVAQNSTIRTEGKDSPFLIQVVSSVLGHCPGVVVQSIHQKEPEGLGLHFENPESKERNWPDNPLRYLYKCADILKESGNAKVMRGKSYRIIWTEASKDIKDKTGTVCWVPSEIKDSQYKREIKTGNLEAASQRAVDQSLATLRNAWQIRNEDVLVLADDDKGWRGHKYLLHSNFPTQEAYVHPRVLHRLDVTPSS